MLSGFFLMGAALLWGFFTFGIAFPQPLRPVDSDAIVLRLSSEPSPVLPRNGRTTGGGLAK
jgi:hypothetical protein